MGPHPSRKAPNFYKIGEIYPLPPPPRSAPQTQERLEPRAPGADSSLAYAALSMARAEISSAAAHSIAPNRYQASSLTTMPMVQTAPGFPRKVSTHEALVAAPSQAGSYYHPASNHSNLLGSYAPSQYSDHYYGSSYDHYPVQGQQHSQRQYYHAEPTLFQRQFPAARGLNEDQTHNHAHESHSNEHGLSHYPPMPPRKVSNQSLPDGKGKPPPEKVSEQDNGTDPFEPIPLV